MKFKVGDQTNLLTDKHHKNIIIDIKDDYYIIDAWKAGSKFKLQDFKHDKDSYENTFELDKEWLFNKEMSEIINEAINER